MIVIPICNCPIPSNLHIAIILVIVCATKHTMTRFALPSFDSKWCTAWYARGWCASASGSGLSGSFLHRPCNFGKRESAMSDFNIT